jgi:hypothetical protein
MKMIRCNDGFDNNAQNGYSHPFEAKRIGSATLPYFTEIRDSLKSPSPDLAHDPDRSITNHAFIAPKRYTHFGGLHLEGLWGELDQYGSASLVVEVSPLPSTLQPGHFSATSVPPLLFDAD